MISVLVTTYIPPGGEKRIATVEACLRSWREHLMFSDDVHVHVADDGSAFDLEAHWRGVVGDWGTFSYTRQERRGLGASLNTGIAACRGIGPIMLYPMDDWRLVGDLDLDPWVTALLKNPDVGCVRLAPSGGLVGGRARRLSPDGDKGRVVAVEFDRKHYYWSLLPALYHDRFFQAYGRFKEDISPVDAETDYNQRVREADGPAVLVALPSVWQHEAVIAMGSLNPEGSQG